MNTSNQYQSTTKLGRQQTDFNSGGKIQSKLGNSNISNLTLNQMGQNFQETPVENSRAATNNNNSENFMNNSKSYVNITDYQHHQKSSENIVMDLRK